MISDVEQVKSKPKRARRLTIHDAEAIARLVATRKLTESEACLTIGIKPHQWIVWRSRKKNTPLFDTIITRTRADSINGLIDRIERAGDDYEITLPNGKVINKRGDWRALAWITEKIEPRFADAPAQPNPPAIAIQVNLIHEQLKKVIGVSNPEPKLIEEHKLKLPQRNK